MNQRQLFKPPPFAKSLIAAKSKRLPLNVFIHAGEHSWRRAKNRPEPHVLCCPPDADYATFDWTCVGGLELTLIVWGRDEEYVDAFAAHLVRAGAKLVAAIAGFDPDIETTAAQRAPQLKFYQPEYVRRGVAA